jgi:hypothetical protein
LSGNATTATTLQTSHNIWGQSFNGSADVTGNMTGVTNIDSLLYFDTTNSRIGINKSDSSYALDVNGDIYTNSSIYISGKLVPFQDATTTTAGLIFVSTATAGKGEWKAASTITSGNATYAANVGAAGTLHTNYVTAAEVIDVYNWYSTMIDANDDADELINRWKEVCDFLNNFTEADTLASVLSTYVTLGTAQTITGAKTFANPISGDLLGNATTADRLKSTTAVGGAGTPVYFTGGLPAACTASNVRTFLGLGTVYSHAHGDYITSITYTPETRTLAWTKGGTADSSVAFGTGAFATIANYLPLAGGTMTGQIRRDYSTANT